MNQQLVRLVGSGFTLAGAAVEFLLKRDGILLPSKLKPPIRP
jgi:hypothetical protein